MKFRKWAMLLVCVVIFFGVTAGCGASGEEFHLTILHTNDWHGVLENMPKYATLVNEIRAETEHVLLLDGGDLYRRGPFAMFSGAAEIDVMNAMGYDAVVFGNNEFPRSEEELFHVAEHPILEVAQFPLLLGNVRLNGELVEGFEPYIILERGDLNIAILGVTSPKPWDREFPFTSRYRFENPVSAVARMVEETGDDSDIQIVLSHAGIELDRQMRGVSAVIGGDDHIALYEPEVIQDGDRQIPIVQAGGEEYHHLGRLDLVFVKQEQEWVLRDFSGELLSLEGVEPDEGIQALIDEWRVLRAQALLPAA